MKKIDRFDLLTEDKNSHQKIRILIVDDQNFVRNFLQHILAKEPNFQIVGTANDGQDGIQKIASLRPDLVLIDLEMPEMDGVTATNIIALKYSECKVLVLTSHKDSEHLQKALRAGANGYLVKDSSPQEITHAIYSVAQGHTQLSPGLLEKVLLPEINIVPEANRENHATLNKLNLPPDSQAKPIKFSHKLSISLNSLLPLLLIFAAIVTPISLFTKIDRTIKIEGQLATRGKTIILDAPVDGEVIALEVKEGEKVIQGQTLIQLESPSINDRLQQQQQALIAQQNQLSGLNFLKNQQVLALSDREQNNKSQALEKQLKIEQLQQNLEALKTSYHNYMTEKTAQLESNYDAIAKAKSAHQLAKIYQSVAQEKVKHYQTVKDKNGLLEAKTSLTESETQLNRTASEIGQAIDKFQEKQNNYNKLQQEINNDIEQIALQVQEQQKSDRLLIENERLAILANEKALQETENQIAKLEREIVETNTSIKDLKLQSKQRTLYTPIDGVVYQLSVKKTGTIVQKKQPLVYITSTKYPLIFHGKARVRDSDLLEVGLPVKLKISNDLVRESSTVSGNLSWISSNTNIDKKAEVVATNIRESATTDDVDIEIELENSYIQAQDRQIFLLPGENAIAEITIKQRRLIDILFDLF